MSGREADSSTGTCVVAGTYRHQGSRSAMLRHAQVGDLVGDLGAFFDTRMGRLVSPCPAYPSLPPTGRTSHYPQVFAIMEPVGKPAPSGPMMVGTEYGICCDGFALQSLG